MSDYIAEKHFYLCKAFPKYKSEMIDLMRAFDSFYQKPVQNMMDLHDYIIEFAVFSNEPIDINARALLKKRVQDLIDQGRLLSPGVLERKYNLKNVEFLLQEYGSTLRLDTALGTKTYLTRDKEADFLCWLHNLADHVKSLDFYTRGLLQHSQSRRFCTAIRNMTATPVVKKPKERKITEKSDVWAIPDDQMHIVATKLALRKRRIKDPNELLNDLVVATVRKNMAKQQ